MASHYQPEPLRQQMLRSLAKSGGTKLRIVASNDSAADWLIRVGPLAKQLNHESKFDGGDVA